MPENTEKELWVEMSIREIRTQANFAEIAYNNIDPKSLQGTDATFSSIHSFLSHCAMVSKMLKATDAPESKSKTGKALNKILFKIGVRTAPLCIGHILKIPESSVIHNRRFRNNLEHYDERLKQWIKKYVSGHSIAAYNIGPKEAIKSTNIIYVSHYDPTDDTFTFVDKDFHLGSLNQEVQKIKNIADAWTKSVKPGNKNL